MSIKLKTFKLYQILKPKFKNGDFTVCYYPSKKNILYKIYGKILAVDMYAYTYYNLEFKREDREYIWKLDTDGEFLTDEEKIELL